MPTQNNDEVLRKQLISELNNASTGGMVEINNIIELFEKHTAAAISDAEIALLKSCYVDQGEIYVRFKGGFAEQYERIRQLATLRQGGTK